MATATRPRAGDLKDRVTLQQQAADQNGDRTGLYVNGITVWAQVLPLNGGDAVMDQRLQGRQPVIVYLRASTATRVIDNSYRLVDAHDTSRIFDVTSAVLSLDRAWVECLAVWKVGQLNG